MSLKHELYGLNYVLTFTRFPKASESRVPLQRLYAGHQATIDLLPVWIYSIL